ncbi:MAG: ribonuclease [Achromobacter sp.]|uniref:RraA family protein n=1 Tax=Achromobacter sp. TaxID=134375 RepID=UPI0025861589|nr:ribonuclease [Achromobacter sp.]MCW0207186.1 ribonuclease [Achromobacter sp.]
MTQTFTPPSYRNAPDVTWSTADLCDSRMDDPAWGLRVLPPVFRPYGGRPWYFGQVVAVPSPDADGALSLAGLLAEPGQGRVLAVDALGNAAHAVLGDRMAAMGVQNGWSGVLLNGYARDTQALARMPLGIHALGTMPNRPRNMAQAAAGTRVLIHGVEIRSGDWLYADTDGVVLLSRRHTDAPGGPAAG